MGPDAFDVVEVIEKYPTQYNESMNTVLTQELVRYNGLTRVIRSSLANVQKAVKGLLVMSGELEAVTVSMLNGQIPKMWSSASYPSLKNLTAYFTDLLARLNMFDKWIEEGPPPVYWISGLFFTQSFLTGTLQNYARKYQDAVDTIRFQFVWLKETPSEKAEDGAYVDGLFIDGAGWDYATMKLCEQKPKVLFMKMPSLWLQPIKTADFSIGDGDYESPVYKTSERRGTLSTTGHSTNFVLSIVIPTSVPSQHWVKRGVACLTQLDD